LEPDPAAVKAFGEMIKAYRSKPGVTIKSTVNISLKQGEVQSREQETKAEFTFDKRPAPAAQPAGDGHPATGGDNPPAAATPRAVMKFKGYTVYLGGGTINVIHEKNPDAYFSTPDEDSAYYTLASMFIDLPFPELALGLGEESVDDLCMQFHPKAPWDKP